MDILQQIQNKWKNHTEQVCIMLWSNVVTVNLINTNYITGTVPLTRIDIIPYDYDNDKLIDIINLISSKYKLYISIDLTVSVWKKINITPNVYHVCNLERIAGALSLESHKIIDLFFLHMPLLTSDDIDSIISYFINMDGWRSSYDPAEVTIRDTVDVVMNHITNMDIPLSKQNITNFIRLKIEIPFIHKYGYNMNDSEFLYAYVKSGFYPQSYNINMDLVNEYKIEKFKLDEKFHLKCKEKKENIDFSFLF